jgi:hypothetical protein
MQFVSKITIKKDFVIDFIEVKKGDEYEKIETIMNKKTCITTFQFIYQQNITIQFLRNEKYIEVDIDLKTYKSEYTLNINEEYIKENEDYEYFFLLK